MILPARKHLLQPLKLQDPITQDPQLLRPTMAVMVVPILKRIMSIMILMMPRKKPLLNCLAHPVFLSSPMMTITLRYMSLNTIAWKLKSALTSTLTATPRRNMRITARNLLNISSWIAMRTIMATLGIPMRQMMAHTILICPTMKPKMVM